jgi:phospholipid transport system substrate-binding protein
MRNEMIRAMLTVRHFHRGCVLLLALVFPAMSFATDAAQPGPGELIQTVATKVLHELDAHRNEMRKDPQKIRKLVDEYLLPHFDTEYSAKLVLAKGWRDATPDQRKRFIEAFYQSLLQNYGEALLDFTPDRLNIQPYRGDPSETTATIRTEVRRDNGQRVPVNYSMRKTEGGWKAFDVTIEGISYVKSFRTDFGSEIEQKGLDAVIQRLEAQQASGAKTTKATGVKAAS